MRSRSTAARRARSEQVERSQQVGSGKVVEVEHLRACVRKTRSVRCSSRVQGCSLAPPSALPRGPGERGTLHAHLCKKVSAALRPHLCGGRAKLSLSKEGCNPACPSLPLPSSRAGAGAVRLTSLCRRRRDGPGEEGRTHERTTTAPPDLPPPPLDSLEDALERRAGRGGSRWSRWSSEKKMAEMRSRGGRGSPCPSEKVAQRDPVGGESRLSESADLQRARRAREGRERGSTTRTASDERRRDSFSETRSLSRRQSLSPTAHSTLS